MSRRRMPRTMRAPITTCDTASQGALWADTLFGDRIGIKPSLEERQEAGWSVGARADDVGNYKALMVARWRGCERVAPHVSTGNRTRATIKALPAAPHHPRPYRI